MAVFVALHLANVSLRPHTSQEQTQAARRWLARSWNVTHPYGSGGVYANFPDPELSDPARAYYGSNLDRLHVVKRNYDLDGVFHSGPAGSLVGTEVRTGTREEWQAARTALTRNSARRCSWCPFRSTRSPTCAPVREGASVNLRHGATLDR